MLKIVTHSGQAHPDDLLACALILYKEAVSPTSALILRLNECKPQEHPGAFIVDIGKHYDPDMLWFDHHQFPKTHEPECAFSLVADHYGLKRNALDWIERMTLLDSKGPYAWYQQMFGKPAKSMREINRALGPDVLNYFARKANKTYENPNAFMEALEEALDWLGEEFKYLDGREPNIRYATSNMKMVQIGDFKIAHFNQKEMRGVSEACDRLSEADPSIIVSSKLDDRGPGYSATRWNNSSRVDFSKLKGEQGCVFAHENGFCLKWENNWEGFLDAIKRSVSAS